MYFTNISYVVHPVGRITPSGISLLGTAFFINKARLLATAAHVTANNSKSIQDYQDTSDNSVEYIPAKIKEINPIADIYILESPSTMQSTFI